MQDPVMQSILQQAQTDPAALQEHMKNPAIRSNIQKLIVRPPLQQIQMNMLISPTYRLAALSA
jgi:hypothetical protein